MSPSVRKRLHTEEKNAVVYMKDLLLILKCKMLVGVSMCVSNFFVYCKVFWELVYFKKKYYQRIKWYQTPVDEQIFLMFPV